MTRTEFDHEIQIAREQIYAEVIDLVVSDPAKMECGNYVLWAAHNLERMADRVTNVCERTVFLSMGALGELLERSGIAKDIRVSCLPCKASPP